MSNLDTPTPDQGDDTPGDSLEALRAQLIAQRVRQKASLAKHKRTTCLAVETAARGTTYYDPEKLKEKLLEQEQDAAASE